MSFDYKPHIMKLKGKEYLPVAARIAWLRSEYPGAHIEAELVTLDLDAQLAVFRATVVIPETGARAVDYGSETAKDFDAYIEKASTKAIGRAIAALGYGTLMALELDEGERVVDSPVNPKGTAQQQTTTLRLSQPRAASSGHGNDAEHAPAATAPQTPPERFVEAAATALATQAHAPAPGEDVCTRRPQAAPDAPSSDPTGALRAEVVALCSVDGEALELLRTWAGGKMPQDWTEEQLRKALPRLHKRLPRSTQLSARIAQARSDEDVLALLGEAQEAKDRRTITQVEYLGLHREAQTRKAALSGPLTAQVGVAS